MEPEALAVAYQRAIRAFQSPFTLGLEEAASNLQRVYARCDRHLTFDERDRVETLLSACRERLQDREWPHEPV
jgi:hypothetical protein